MEKLLTLPCLRRVIWAHGASGALVVLVDEVFERQLCIEHAAILSLFNSHIIQYFRRLPYQLTILTLRNLEHFLFDIELVIKPILCQELLQLTLEDKVEYSPLSLHPWNFQKELCLF